MIPIATRSAEARRYSDAIMRKSPIWLKLGRRLFPSWVWSGAGTITRKTHLEAAPAGGKVTVGRYQTGFVSGVVDARWVLVVTDSSGKDHYVNVGLEVWERHDIGDVIDADDPLINIP